MAKWVKLSTKAAHTSRVVQPRIVKPRALASQRGLLAVVSVLGSLFPIVTVLLAHIVLHERITGIQRLGVAVALAGVAVVSAA